MTFSSGKPEFIKAIKNLSKSNASEIINNLYYDFAINSANLFNMKDNLLYIKSNHLEYSIEYEKLFLDKLKKSKNDCKLEIKRRCSNYDFLNMINLESEIIKINQYLKHFVGENESFM